MRVRYDGLDSAVDVEMGNRKIHTLAVRVADYAGAVFPQLFLFSFFLPCIFHLTHPFCYFCLPCLSQNTFLSECNHGKNWGGGGRRGLKSLPFRMYIVSLQHLNCYDEIKTHLVSCRVVGNLDYPELYVWILQRQIRHSGYLNLFNNYLDELCNVCCNVQSPI